LWYGWDNEIRVQNPFNKNRTYNILAWSNDINDEDVDALLARGRLYDFTRVPLNDRHREDIEKSGGYWLPYDNGYKPTAKEVNDWNLQGMGHDSLNASIVIEAKLKRFGLHSLCPKCDGKGSYWEDSLIEGLYNEWSPSEPPIGKGYQVWESVSDGSPVSPVFKNPDDLAKWMIKNDTSATKDTSYKSWKNFIEKEGCSVSAIMNEDGIKSGVEWY